jgi:hypothetical protein
MGKTLEVRKNRKINSVRIKTRYTEVWKSERG